MPFSFRSDWSGIEVRDAEKVVSVVEALCVAWRTVLDELSPEVIRGTQIEPEIQRKEV